MIEVDIVKVVIDVLIVFPLLMAILLHLDYKVNGKYDIEFKIRDVKFRNEESYRKLWEFVTGEKLEVKRMSKQDSIELNEIGNAGLRFYIKICKAYNEYIEELKNIVKNEKEKLDNG